MKNLIIIFSIFANFIFIGYSEAQIIRNSLLYGIPSAINPGMTAISGGSNSFGTGSRTQWGNQEAKFRTNYIYYGKTIVINRRGQIAGMELSYINDNAGGFKTNILSLSFAPDILLKVGDMQSRIRFGLQGSIVTRKFNPWDLTFENQFDGSGFDPNISPSENFTITKLRTPVVNVGFLYYTLPKQLERRQFNPFFGASFQNIARSDVSFYENGYYHEPTTRFIAHGGLRFDNRFAIEVTPHFFYMKENITQEIAGALNLKFNFPDFISTGFKKSKRSIMIGSCYRYNSGIATYLAFDILNWQIGFSYDLNNNGLSNGTVLKSTMEVGIKHRVFGSKQNQLFTTGGRGFESDNLPIPLF